jgi:hypothetical protein
MKTKILFSMIAAMTAFATLAFAGNEIQDNKPPANKKPATPTLLVEPATISAPANGDSYSFALAAHTVWSAAVNADAASWCWVQPSSGNGDKAGAITVMYNPTVNARTATVTFTSGSLSRKVTIKQEGGAASAPPHAESGETWMWVFGKQMWSNAIHMPECNKEDFIESETEPDCRSYTENGETKYYYNWAYVNTNRNKLCPSPWRVPTKADMETLGSNSNENALFDAWGFGGNAYGSSVGSVSTGAYYWSSTEYRSGSSYAYNLGYGSSNLLVLYDTKSNGFQVRCVK